MHLEGRGKGPARFGPRSAAQGCPTLRTGARGGPRARRAPRRGRRSGGATRAPWPNGSERVVLNRSRQVVGALCAGLLLTAASVMGGGMARAAHGRSSGHGTPDEAPDRGSACLRPTGSRLGEGGSGNPILGCPPRPPAPPPPPIVAGRRAILSVHSDPVGYASVDGRPLGTTPIRGVYLDPGLHRLRLVSRCGRTVEPLRLSPGERREVHLSPCPRLPSPPVGLPRLSDDDR